MHMSVCLHVYMFTTYVHVGSAGNEVMMFLFFQNKLFPPKLLLIMVLLQQRKAD